MDSIFAVFFLLSLTFVRGGAQSQQNQCPEPISLGSSLTTDHSWPSFSRKFKFGFYQQGSGLMVGIWLVAIGQTTVVWTANRDDPPVSSNATLELTRGGELVLRTGEQGRKEKHIATTLSSDSASFACMLDSGNFVLYNKYNFPIWETFKHPTDTILGGQILSTDGQLISSLSETNHSTGRFLLKMQSDGNLVLNLIKSADIRSEPYWSSNTHTYSQGLNYSLYLNNTGILQIIKSTSMDSVEDLYSSSASNNTVYRATLDVNGFFQLYSYSQAIDRTGELKSSSSSEWSAPGDKDPCDLKGLCGFNSFCTSQNLDSTRYDSKSNCLCLPGTEFVNLNDKTLGCKRNFSEVGCEGGKDHVASYNIIIMENITWPEDNPYIDVPMSTKEECGNSCFEDCNCEAALFINSHCQRQKLPLSYVTRNGSEYTIAFFKVGTRSIKSWNETRENPPVHVFTNKRVIMQILVLILAFSAFSCLALGIAGLYMFKIRVLRYKRLKESETLVLTQGLALNLFSYNDLKRATNGFKDMLGKGSFGTVYKGALYKGKKLVAVKRLEKLVEEGEREFRAEMRAIGRTHHKNLVRLLGYCVEGSKRLLVYEFMSNGSLADVLFRGIRRLDWGERVRIALDVARGILYLHEEGRFCKIMHILILFY